MKNTTVTNRQNKIINFLSGLEIANEIDLVYYANHEEINSFEDLQNLLDDNGAFNIDVIYYASAMDYLRENDPSLNESMEIANEFGYTTENLNSELLASLLKSQNVRNDFYELEEEINDFFAELEEEEENE